jgi:hypothetical protein
MVLSRRLVSIQVKSWLRAEANDPRQALDVGAGVGLSVAY